MSSAASPGPSTSALPPIVICDLDGTVLSVNSFPFWVRYLIFGHFGDMPARDRLELSFSTIVLMVQRKLMNKDHGLVKAELQRLWLKACKQDNADLGLDWLVGDLSFKVRPNLRLALQKLSHPDAQGVLATAAADCYAVPLANKLGFRYVLATPQLPKDKAGVEKFHNVGAVKRDRVLEFLKVKGWGDAPRVFLTDHSEDKPLIEVCDKILWFGAPAAMKPLQDAMPGKIFVAALPLDEIELLRELSILPPEPAAVPAAPPPVAAAPAAADSGA